MADQPFAFASEIAQENQDIVKAASLITSVVWANCNIVNAGDVTGDMSHLERLTVIDFQSNGPFSESYSMEFRKDDGSTVLWKTGLTANVPVYNHQQFYQLFQKSFYQSNPLELHPNWPEDIRTNIKNQKVSVGMDQAMVLLSWGNPNRIAKATPGYELWLYNNQTTLYFKDKAVVRILIPDPKQATANKGPASKLVEVPDATIKDNVTHNNSKS
jgi:hypothetical protein